jgi:hypothetical protein
MIQGRRSARIAAVLAFLMGTVGLGLAAGPATAVTSTERADTLDQARDDAAIAVKQVINERLNSSGDKDWFRYVIAGRTRAVVTLGSLPANYNLAVYREDGSRVAVSDHSGKGFERIYFTASAGTYYVRVASTKGSSNAPYRLWLRTLTGPLALQSYTVPPVDSDYPFIVAELVNTTGNWLRVAGSMVVNSMSADGRLLQRDAIEQSQLRVAPYGLLHVAGTKGLPPPAGHDHYQFAPVMRVVDADSVSALKRTTGPTLTRDGYRVHTGTVKNTGSVTRGGDDDPNLPSVEVGYYNANGTLIGTTMTNLKTMAPGATVKYQVTARQSTYWYSPFPKANRIVTRVLPAF